MLRQIARCSSIASATRLSAILGSRKATFSSEGVRKMEINKDELKARLTPMQYHVTQERGTERAHTGCYDKFYETGTYVCVVCEQPLFSSNTKYDSGCGWPAFNDVLDKGKVKLSPDASGGRLRTEVSCSKCNAHLGHVFDDGPAPTKKRFCINSASINFIPKDNAAGDS